MMTEKRETHVSTDRSPLWRGLLIGIVFGFLLHKGGVTKYDVIVGGLIFGVGFAVLGYCPGTIAGAVGNGSLDALFGGVVGIVIGSGLFAALYPKLKSGILAKGDFGELTFPKLFKVNDWMVVIPGAALIVLLLFWLESTGL